MERDDLDAPQAAALFWDQLLLGSHCDSNWLEGQEPVRGPWINDDEDWEYIGSPEDRPPFTRDAPALLGFDPMIGQGLHGGGRRGHGAGLGARADVREGDFEYLRSFLR